MFSEPSEKEKRPAFAEIPQAMLQKIADCVHARVTGGEVVHGGLSASANFRLTLEDGRRIFAKGNHPGEQAHGMQNLRQEILVYNAAPVLAKISPRFIGSVEDGDEDGWALGLWEWIGHGPAPSAREIAETLALWQRAEVKGLEDCRVKNYISQFFTPGKKWHRVRDEEKMRAGFCRVFHGAEGWLDKNLETLCALQEKITDLSAPFVPLHGDLRADNAFRGADGKVYIVDWPNACRGPAAFDLLFLGASLGKIGALVPKDDDARVVAACLAGYLATQAGRAVPGQMPRLRWMQKRMLHALLAWLEDAGVAAGTNQLSEYTV